MTALKTVTRDEWVAALRSGEFKQAPQTLYDPATRGYCCLGVLCHLAGVHNRTLSRLNDYAPGGTDSCAKPDRPELAALYAGVGLQFDPSSPASPETFAAMNDEGQPFSEIADEIERLLPENPS